MPLNYLYLNYALEMTLKQTNFELGFLIIHDILSQLFNATDNLKATMTTHCFLDLNEKFIEWKSNNKNLFWHDFEKIFCHKFYF